METWDAITSRRDVRSFSDQAIAPADLDRVLEAAWRAPSSQNELAAADLGVGSGHSAVADQELARRILGFPDDRYCALLIPLGYPADRPLRPISQPNRRPFDEVVHRDRW